MAHPLAGKTRRVIHAAPETAVQKAGRWSWKKFCASQGDSNQKTHEMQAYRKKRMPQARQTQMDAGDAKRHKIRKRGLFHSPNIRITCIIRNFIKSKTGHPLLSAFLHGCNLVSAAGHLRSFGFVLSPVCTKTKIPETPCTSLPNASSGICLL